MRNNINNLQENISIYINYNKTARNPNSVVSTGAFVLNNYQSNTVQT